ncbi:MAG TPA: hypothetical protein VNN17_13515 [Terriglobia bacterium]|nr:hypothetical protein [Terriglobia bacterium]
MTRIRLQIDIGGTIGTEAWDTLKHYEEATSGWFGPEEGSRGPCEHLPSEPHQEGEWFGAVVLVEHPLLAEYAVAHYLEQPRVKDAFREPEEPEQA